MRTPVASVNRSHPLNQKLAGWWLTTPGSRALAWLDLTGRYIGTLVEGPTWLSGAGRPGRGAIGGFSVAGSPRVDLPATLFSSTTASMALLFRLDGGNTGSYQGLVSAYTSDSDAFEIFYEPGQQVFGGNFSNKATSAGGVITTDVWHHVVLTSDGATTTIYVDGAASGTTGTVNFATRSVTPTVGRRGSFYLDKTSAIDDVRVYDGRCLSAGDVRQLYDLSRQGYPGLLATTRRVSVKKPAAAAALYGIRSEIFAGVIR